MTDKLGDQTSEDLCKFDVVLWGLNTILGFDIDKN